jgi:hypothetical protein
MSDNIEVKVPDNTYSSDPKVSCSDPDVRLPWLRRTSLH